MHWTMQLKIQTTLLYCTTFSAWNFLVANRIHLHSRFLTAQKFNLTLALQQFDHVQTWRKEHDIQSFYRNVDVGYYEASRKMVWTPAGILYSYTKVAYLTNTSIPNGQAEETKTETPSTSSQFAI